MVIICIKNHQILLQSVKLAPSKWRDWTTLERSCAPSYLQSSLFEALSYTLNGNEGKGPWAKSFHLSELAPTRFLLYLRLTCLFVLSTVFFLSPCVYPRPSKLFPESVFLHIHTTLQPRRVRTEVL